MNSELIEQYANGVIKMGTYVSAGGEREGRAVSEWVGEWRGETLDNEGVLGSYAEEG